MATAEQSSRAASAARLLVSGLALGLACATDPIPGSDHPDDSAPAASNPPPPVETLDPAGDEDGDSIANGVDQCPLRPETYQGIDDEDGCPDIPGTRYLDCDFVLRLISLRDVDFAPGEHQLDVDDQAALEGLIDFMTADPNAVVTIAGHSDGHERGRGVSTQQLSEQRAESVRAHVIAQGVDGERITTKGFGDQRPLPLLPSSADGTRPHASNRRVEIDSMDHPMCPEFAAGGASARAHELDAGP